MRFWIILAFIVATTGCSTNHFSEAILYKKTTGSTYGVPKTGNNPVYVDSKSVFQLEIEYLQPGWIHNGESMPTLDDDSYIGFKKNITRHLYGKELWLLTKIESLSSEDVLERNSKTYYKTTNIKLNSESYAKVALDQSEKVIFSHEADSQYRITFKLYEVDGFDIKKAAVKAYDDSPGLAGIFLTIGQTITSTLGSLAGSIVTDLWKSANEEQLFVERLLLENDATLEFQGALHVLREDGILNASTPMKNTEYVLYDKFKSDAWDTKFSDKASYQARKLEKDQNIDISPPVAGSVDTKSYIKLKVTEALSNPSSAAIGIAPLAPNHIEFLNSIKID
jgi:hypothetical protein